ncbi:MAG: RsmE family RNA methyltransferase [Patescibacteria group bacterium]
MRGNSDRFYIKKGLGEDLLLINDFGLIKQWRRVLRLNEGDVLRLFDGSGWEYIYEIILAHGNGRGTVPVPKTAGINLQLVNKRYVKETKNKIILGFGLLKNHERTEWIIEKCTELGVDEFQPLITEYSQINIFKNRTRLEKKIVEASEQSGRVRLPKMNDELQMTNYKPNDQNINVCMDVGATLAVAQGGRQARPYNNGGAGVIPPDFTGNILLLVGPEGGWSETERKWLSDQKFKFWSINNNILRAETAAVVGVGILKCHL